MRWTTGLMLCAITTACGGSANSGGDASGGTTGSSGSGGNTAGAGAGGMSGNSGAGTGGNAAAGNGGAAGNAAAGSGGTAGGSAFNECRVNSDCVVAPASCCGNCGVATRQDAIGLNQSQAREYRLSVCGQAACPPCAAPQDPTLIATCDSGKCEVVDILTHESTACKDSSECSLRTNECCPCGGSQDIEHLIAVSNRSAYPALVCDPNQACDACEPPVPDRASAYCDEGHCVAEWALD